MIAEGADILDIGGQSTRPGSVRIGASEELARVLPAITAIHQQFPEIILSVDTYHAEVARAAVAAGAGIVNDVSGGLLDEAMLPAVAALRVPFICMHMKGSPGTMQQEAVYDDVVREVLDYFIGRVDACRRAGITDIILDPGFGFAKTAQHNFILLRHLRSLQLPGTALLAGLSRKSTIYKTLGTTAAGALNGTTVLHTIALLNGAQILRVHDVKEAREVVTLVEAYENNKA
jgi:dihydropteroate synthase